jgi:hypothetical protein
MTRVLVVWEDTYWEPLKGLMRSLVRARSPALGVEIPSVLCHTARSNSAFDRYAHTTWPAVRSKGLPTDPGPIDHLVCVVDADRLHDLLPARIPRPPGETGAIAAWHVAAEREWQEHLRAQCDPSGPAVSTVHGAVLRWAKESLLLAGYDQPAMGAHLEIASEHPDVAAVLATCKPHPRDIADERFTDTYRRPSTCLKLLREARKLGALHKNAPEIDDALRALARESLAKVRDRAPDIARIAALIWALHQGEAIATPPAPTPPGGSRKTRQAKGAVKR